MKYLLIGLILSSCTTFKSKDCPQCDTSKVSIDTIKYRPGKNEICTQKKSREYNGKITRIIEITDAYSGTDKEVHCTVVFDSKSPGNNMFSASSRRCAKLKERAGYDDVIVDVVHDHICGI